jgi:tRNA A37 N6-isopentenylltransferase MiaA
MKDWQAKEESFTRYEVPFRLGNLASSLAHIKSCAGNEAHKELVKSFVEESKFFIEWTAGDMDIDRAAELADMQIQLARWQLTWDRIWADQAELLKVINTAKLWSDRVLDMSGLLNEPVETIMRES